ncbi:uncharacterized protein LOC123246383 [Gracilinanus agilis]|uniref:uncharacterized protein LOC123246383 n=1 Tax=Gracilinanus agilis TaxID=191870 RepID=UPI001CFC47AB|nr:uncharacterized protein LOC123246383 [Gracilinanus agilis]
MTLLLDCIVYWSSLVVGDNSDPNIWGFVQDHKSPPRNPLTQGPRALPWTEPSALKVDGIGPWIHHSHVKAADPPEATEVWTATSHPNTPLKLKLHPNSMTLPWAPLSLACFLSILQTGSFHQPWKWSLISLEHSTVLATVVTSGTPSLQTETCDLIWGPKDIRGPPSNTPESICRNTGVFYLCPASNPGKPYCNQTNQYYCANWGCETIVTGGNTRHGCNPWTPPNPDSWLTVGWGPRACGHHCRNRDPYPKIECNQLVLEPLQATDQSWMLGRTWGIRWYRSHGSGPHLGGLFTIQKEPALPPSIPIGPNPVLNPSSARPPKSPPPTSLPSPQETTIFQPLFSTPTAQVPP